MEDDRILQRVATVDRQHVAFAESTSVQAGSHSLNGIRPIRIGQDATARSVDERRLVAAIRRALEKKRRQRHFGNRHGWLGRTKDHECAVCYCDQMSVGMSSRMPVASKSYSQKLQLGHLELRLSECGGLPPL